VPLGSGVVSEAGGRNSDRSVNADYHKVSSFYEGLELLLGRLAKVGCSILDSLSIEL
jgi:hypothetical protein